MNTRKKAVGWLAILVAAAVTTGAQAQFVTTAIGGVSVDPNGVLTQPSVTTTKSASEMLRKQLHDVPDALEGLTEFRLVSLTGIQNEVEAAVAEGRLVDQEARFLGGLQRVQHVFVDPGTHDIFLAGPAEGWTVDDRGIVVGVTTGKPVVLLEDLLVALRSVEAARTVGITCSIDPTESGRRALRAFLRKQKRFSPGVKQGVEKALGPQQISITGVPTDSHFARVLVAADFRMKRLAMMLEPAPIADLPSFLELVQSSKRSLNNMMPRWWLACHYDPVHQSEDGLAWEIRGQGVKVMTEDEIISASGQVKGSGKVNPLAQQWADNMTSQYETLALADTIFGQLRNVMDLSLVAAIIERNDLRGLAGADLQALYQGEVAMDRYPTPKTVSTQSSILKVGREFVVTASGGVQIDSWKWASETEVSDLTEAKTQFQKKAQVGSGWVR